MNSPFIFRNSIALLSLLVALLLPTTYAQSPDDLTNQIQEKEKQIGELEKQLEDLISELKSVGIHNPENPADWIAVPEGVDANQSDTDLLADVVEEWDERAALVATLERQYNDVTRALGKVK